jgi:NAD+ synthase (glutamine-hydrolysing)
MKIAIAQINTTVGNITGNFEKIISNITKAKNENADLVVFPELTLTGYPPRDLLIKKSFVKKNIEVLNQLIDFTENIAIVVGFVDEKNGNLYNAAAFIKNKKIVEIYHKIHLPNYDVFDEKRYFTAGSTTSLVNFKGVKLGLTICEDIWIDNGPAYDLKKKGAELIINISASPFHAGKEKIRLNVVAKQAKENNIPIVYCNLIGGQDDLIFDGRSYVINCKGKLVQQSKSFVEELSYVSNIESKNEIAFIENENESIYNALVLGVKDYFRKNGFKNTVIGLSGGIDSALTAAIAVDALGKDNVRGVSMPSKFSSKGSISDSLDLAENLEIPCDIVPIKDIYNSYLKTLKTQFANTKFNVAEENIQARIRGNILMALSNKFGYLVLTTGNKSESSVGYSTLYGDMAGGLAVISDVLKTKVYELSRYINEVKGKEVIPVSTITKPPSAELREDQKDSDSLPEYDILDPILKAYVEDDLGKEAIIKLGFDDAIVIRIINLVDRNEYKRQQAALGLRITSRAFGQGRRMPITNRWKDD